MNSLFIMIIDNFKLLPRLTKKLHLAIVLVEWNVLRTVVLSDMSRCCKRKGRMCTPLKHSTCIPLWNDVSTWNTLGVFVEYLGFLCNFNKPSFRRKINLKQYCSHFKYLNFQFNQHSSNEERKFKNIFVPS